MSSKYYRFASRLLYIGNTVSGSVSGYWTIWQVSGPGAQPVPVHINLCYDELKAYRGKLWMLSEHTGELVRAFPTVCPHCGRDRMREEGEDLTCSACRDYCGLSDPA